MWNIPVLIINTLFFNVIILIIYKFFWFCRFIISNYIYHNLSQLVAQHRRFRVVPSVAQVEPAELVETDQSESHFSDLLHPSHSLCYDCSDVRESRWNWWVSVINDSWYDCVKYNMLQKQFCLRIWLSDDIFLHTCLPCIYLVEKKTEILPKRSR